MHKTNTFNQSLAFPSTLGLTESVDTVCKTKHGQWERTMKHFVRDGPTMHGDSFGATDGANGGGNGSNDAAKAAADKSKSIGSRMQTPGPPNDPFATGILVDGKGNLLRGVQPPSEAPGVLQSLSKPSSNDPNDHLSRTMDLWKTINPGCMKDKIKSYYRTTYKEFHSGHPRDPEAQSDVRFNFKRNDFTEYTESRAKMVQMTKKQLT